MISSRPLPPDPLDLSAGYSRLLRAGALAALGLAAAWAQSPARAADSATADGPTVQLDRMVVNDNADKAPAPFADVNVDLPRTVDDAKPYYLFSGPQVDQLDATSLEDFFKRDVTMDTTSKANGQGSSRLADGSINLRGLGTNQTLILIDGRRSMSVSYQGTDIQADINSIPIAAIERIEVLPSSASGIYGGNAVGGAINVVLKRDYNGGEIKYSYDSPFNSHIPEQSIDATAGFTLEGGKTHVMVSADYLNAQGVLMRDRVGIVNQGIADIVRNAPASYYTTAKPPWGSTPNIASTNGSNLVLKDGTALNSPITYIPSGFSPTSNPDQLAANAGQVNLALPNGVSQHFGLQANLVDSERVKSFLTTIRRSMTDQLEIFADFWTHSNFANPTNGPIFNTFTVPASAPTNPFNQSVNIAFPVSLPSDLPIETTGRRATVGFTLKLPGDWKAEGDYSWETYNYVYLFRWSDASSGSVGPIQSAIANGTLNPFVDTLKFPLYPVNPYLANDSYYANSSMNDLGLRLSGSVWRLPAGPAKLTIGLEHRREGDDDAHQYFVVNDFSSDNTDQVYYGHSQDIDSAYLEATISLIAPANRIPGVNLLDLDLAGRTESFTVHGGTTTNYAIAPAATLATNIPYVSSTSKYDSSNPTLGLRYKPVDGVMFRTSYSSAFVAPTYSQLAGTTIPTAGTTNVIDPLRGNAIEAIQTIVGGNAQLKSQKATNWDLGVIFEPAAIRGLRFNLEWYQVKETNVITTVPVQTIIGSPGDYPGRVVRGPVPAGDPYGVGPITLVNDSTLNLTTLSTQGFDLSADYRLMTAGLGTFDFSVLGTIIEHYKTQSTLNGPQIDYVNRVNDAGPAKYKANGTLAWSSGPLTLGWRSEFYGWYLQTPTLVAAQGSDHVPSQLYHEIFARYSFPRIGQDGRSADQAAWYDRALSGTTIQVGIKDLFNTAPPFDAGFAYHYYSPFGDIRLRDFALSVTKSF